MPSRRARGSPVDPTLCRRCQTALPTITVRTEPLCAACFAKYVTTKAVKRMESFRVRHADPGATERLLLLPLSFGTCSTALLYILDHHLKGQAERTGRKGFRLHVLHVEEPRSDGRCGARSSDRRFNEFRERFPEHTYSTIHLSDVFANEEMSQLLTHAVSGASLEQLDHEGRLSAVLASVTSATFRADLVRILVRRLIVSFAERHTCEAILWGDTTTRLAERTLAETAKGRGFALPWMVTDDAAQHAVPSYYPLQDVLSKEVTAFGCLVEPSLENLVIQDLPRPTTNTKNTTVDHLMKQYFESVEQDYPSIVANVVKTTGKLRPLALDEFARKCELCDIPLDGAAPEQSRLCYGCIRTLSVEG